MTDLHILLSAAPSWPAVDTYAALLDRLRGRSERETRGEREGAPVQLEIGEVA